MTEPRLTLQQVRRRSLVQQHLAPDAPAHSLEGLAADLLGLHATGTSGPYLQAFARLPGFRKDALDRALYQERSLIRVRCMRATVFILPLELARLAVVATRDFVEPRSVAFLAAGGVTERDYRDLADRIEDLLAGTGGALTAAALRARLGVGVSLSGVVNLMCDQGRLVRDRPIGSWRSRTISYRLPDGDLPSGDPEMARRALVARYIERYGPVSVNDVAWWTGLSLGMVRAAVRPLQAELASVSVEGWTEPGLVRAAELDALPGDRTGEPSVVLLPELDPYLMGYRDRTRNVPTGRGDFIVDVAGNATSVVLLDGLVVGVWGTAADRSPSDAGTRPTVRVHLFAPPDRLTLARVHRAAAELGRFWHDREASVENVREMAPLRGRPAGSVMAPLPPSA